MDSNRAVNGATPVRLRLESFWRRSTRRASLLILSGLVFVLAASAQSPPPDSQQTMLAEIRQLRQDLQAAAATIQRVQIVMFRIQAQSALLNSATDRAEQTHAQCANAQQQQANRQNEVQQAEARLRNAQNPAQKEAAEEQLENWKQSLSEYRTETQLCPVREAEAQTQLRNEQAKMNDLEAQLEKLDKLLSGLGAK